MNSRLTRRKALAILGGVAACGAGGAYPFVEARRLRVVRRRVALPRLPASFSGFKMAVLSDVHHSRSVPLSLIRHAVERAAEERPDAVLLCGDYVTGRARYIAPCLEVLGALSAPHGVYAVLGNHDHAVDPVRIRSSLEGNGIDELTNRGRWLRRGGDRLRLGGVGDLWRDSQDLDSALGDVAAGEGAVILSHNPDYAEEIQSDRVDLLVSGHTHGGQVRVPLLGAPFIPSRYGMKYAGGLVRGPRCLVYVTRGVGTVGPPARLGCRPEVNVLELVSTRPGAIVSEAAQ
jgi:predicted MPP superfamily phosphohydrolase